jgi:mxaA protein
MTGRRAFGWRCALLLAGAFAPFARADAASSAGAEAASAASAASAPVAAVVEQPRPFGHVIGDVLTQRVLLAADPPPAPASMPGPQRLSAWIERRSARIERAADGQRWLVVDYQVVNAPLSPATVRIPAWLLAGDAARPGLLVPAWPIGVSPITARAAPGTSGWQLRPDRPAPVIATGPRRLRLALASAALAAWLAAWAGWLAWRRWHDAMTQPFASALRALAREDDRHPSDWRALHEAFDRTAGEVLRPSTLPRLFERAPQFEPLRDRIEGFYAQSAARFFGDAPVAPAAGAVSPLALCRDLRRVERRSAR